MLNISWRHLILKKKNLEKEKMQDIFFLLRYFKEWMSNPKATPWLGGNKFSEHFFFFAMKTRGKEKIWISYSF